MTHPMDDHRPITVSMGVLYTLMCGGSIATGAFDGSREARESVIMSLTVIIPWVKRKMRQSGWEGEW